MAGRMLRELCITKACLTFVKLSELSWLATLVSKNLSLKQLGRIVYVYRLEGHESRLGRDCLCLSIEKALAMIQSLSSSRLYDKQISWYTRTGGDNFRHFLAFFVLLPSRQVNYELILVIVDLHDEPVQIPIDTPWLPDSIDWDSVLISKSWSSRYHFQARLRLPTTRLLRGYWIKISWLHAWLVT